MGNVEAAIRVDAIPAMAVACLGVVVPEQVPDLDRSTATMNPNRVDIIDMKSATSPKDTRTRSGLIHQGLPFVRECLWELVAEPVHMIKEYEPRQGPW